MQTNSARNNRARPNDWIVLVPRYMWEELPGMMKAHSSELRGSAYGRMLKFLIEANINDGTAGLGRRGGVSQPTGKRHEGVQLLTDDPDKLIPLIDQMLFWLRIRRYKTRPLTIRESGGAGEIRWNGRKPKAFSGRMLVVISEGQHIDGFQVAAAKRATLRL